MKRISMIFGLVKKNALSIFLLHRMKKMHILDLKKTTTKKMIVSWNLVSKYLHRVEQIGSSLATLKWLQSNQNRKYLVQQLLSILSNNNDQHSPNAKSIELNWIRLAVLFTFDISSSWLAKCARQWTQEYVLFDGGKYAWNVLTILELFRCSFLSELQNVSFDFNCKMNNGFKKLTNKWRKIRKYTGKKPSLPRGMKEEKN